MRTGAARLGGAVAAMFCVALGPAEASAEDLIRLFAATPLKAALTEIIKDFEATMDARVEVTFGTPAQLRERLEKGEPAELFLSTSMEHPRALSHAGLATPARPFARNPMCALARPPLALTPETLLDRLLEQSVRVGTSTPKADPAGDHAWELFAKAEALRPGAANKLRAKAMQLTGATDSPRPPDGRNVFGWLMEQDRADVFLTYCTNARQAVEEEPVLTVVPVPEPLAVTAVYGLAILKKGDAAKGAALAEHIQSPSGQAVLASYGYTRP
ncbi:molybdate ABC transporter substrate-binding protein [Azospirillum sp. sgz302134]